MCERHAQMAREASRAWHAANHERSREAQRRWYAENRKGRRDVCGGGHIGCERVPLVGKTRCASCAKWERRHSAEWRAKYPERSRATVKSSQTKNAHVLRAWRRANRARLNAAHRAWVEAQGPEYKKLRARGHKAWRKANPEMVRAAHNKRRALQLGAPGGGVSAREWETIYADFGGFCAYCPEPATTMDHVHPLARGGAHDPSNVVPACLRCNSSKRHKTVPEWLGCCA